MRGADYDPDAPKRTVSLTVNSDLYARAKKLGLNASRIAEQALADATLGSGRQPSRPRFVGTSTP
jgi:hypothetical protein